METSSTPFQWIDSHRDNYFLGIFSDPRHWRRRFTELALASAFLWAVLGFDSTWEMVDPLLGYAWRDPVWTLRALLSPGGDGWNQIAASMWSMYGLGNHWSAPVIYGFAYVWLSRRLEDEGVRGSANFFCTSALSLGNVGLFELAWNRLYSLFQGQAWTCVFAWPQSKNLAFFSVFVVVGVLALVLLQVNGFRVRVTRGKGFLLLAAAALWALWVFYPFPAARVAVETAWGMWASSPLFPQTFYAVKVLDDGLAQGLPFYAPDTLLHLVNVLCKAASALAVASLSAVTRNE